jgi:hypothetical protein
MLKLYVVIREDLKPGLELAQGIHAAVELAILKPEDALAWRRESQNVAALGVADEAVLRQALGRVRENGRPSRPVPRARPRGSADRLRVHRGRFERRGPGPLELAARAQDDPARCVNWH